MEDTNTLRARVEYGVIQGNLTGIELVDNDLVKAKFGYIENGYGIIYKFDKRRKKDDFMSYIFLDKSGNVIIIDKRYKDDYAELYKRSFSGRDKLRELPVGNIFGYRSRKLTNDIWGSILEEVGLQIVIR